MSKGDYLRLEGMSDEEYLLRKELIGPTAVPVYRFSGPDHFVAEDLFKTQIAYESELQIQSGSGTAEWEESFKVDVELDNYSLFGLESIEI